MRKKVLLAGSLALFLFIAACAGLSQDPKISKIQSATITCGLMTGAINTLAIMKGAGSLSADQIAQVDLTIEIVKPACGVVKTSGDLFDLDALEAQLFELQRLAGGA